MIGIQKFSFYFTMFNLPRSFVVSGNDLKKAYYKLMEENHPDRHLSQKRKEQVNTTTDDTLSPSATSITHAYTTLLNPYDRAVHMLGLLGRPLEESSMNPEAGMEFLVKIMELREVIESTTDDDQLMELLQENRSRIKDICVQLNEAFDAHELQYWNRVDETLREKIEVIQ